MRAADPLANPEPLIRRTYAYVAYRIGAGPDAEDVTSTAVERSLRYRASYDPRRGDALSWLIGIARTCVNDYLRGTIATDPLADDQPGPANVETEVVTRLSITAAVSALDEREQELIALRYGADLTAREIGRVLDMRTNAIEVALHRCRERLRGELERAGYSGGRGSSRAVPRPAPEPSTS